MASTTTVNKNFNGDFNIIINHKVTNGYETIKPIVEDGVKWETERQGSPSKLTFKVYKDKNDNNEFQEGDTVALKYHDDSDGWVILFSGYIFTKKRSKELQHTTSCDILRIKPLTFIPRNELVIW